MASGSLLIFLSLPLEVDQECLLPLKKKEEETNLWKMRNDLKPAEIFSPARIEY